MSKNRPVILLQVIFPQKTESFELSQFEFTLGRADTALVPIQDGGISREHLRVKLHEGSIQIQDLDSSNGTFLEGIRLRPQEWVHIHESQTISFGNAQVKIKLRPILEVATQVTPAKLQPAEPPPPAAEGSKVVTSVAATPAPTEQRLTPPLPTVPSPKKNVPPQIPLMASGPKPPPPMQTAPAPAAAQPVTVPPAPQPVTVPPTAPQPVAVPPTAPVIPEIPPLPVDLSAFPKTAEDFKMSFKNVGLHVPKQRNNSEQGQEILKEAEYIKQAMIKSADVYKARSINEAKIQAQKASEEAYVEYQKLVDRLLEDTRFELQRLKTETEMVLDEKRLQANEEIQNLWQEHRELIRKDKEKQYEAIEKENIVKLELSIEKMKSDMFSEKNNMITEAEGEILHKKRFYQIEFECEKSEHLELIRKYTEELNQIQEQVAVSEKIQKEKKALKDETELDLGRTQILLKQEQEKLDQIKSQYEQTLLLHKDILKDIEKWNQTKTEWQLEQEAADKKLVELKQAQVAQISQAEKERDEMNRVYSNLTEKKEKMEESLKTLSQSLEDSKRKVKKEVETEYKTLKEVEMKKFDDYKTSEIKELQKIRDTHTDSIKKFSVDLSQEIASKMEMLAKKNNAPFDFDKHFELINSVIQVKSAINTGSESKHSVQLDNWKRRKSKENFSLMSRGFAMGLVIVFAANYVYKKLNTDPVQEEMARIALERKQKDAENAFVPQKTNQYYGTYVESTLYTENFTETYLDDQLQQEWVNYATKYFLRQWKVEEEKVIQVVANSRALVQSINEARPTLKKDRIKNDLEKLKTMEHENVQNQATILGSNVRYEAYKKIEKEFFAQRVQSRQPAGK